MDNFPPLLCIFYAEFDPIQGPIVVYQVPEEFIKTGGGSQSLPGSSTWAVDASSFASPTEALTSPVFITPRSGQPSRTSISVDDSNSQTKLDFDTISEYIIPKPELCGRLVTIYADDFKIIGLPVSIEDSNLYERNNFLFNLCFVFDKGAPTASYNQVIQKISRELRSIEVRAFILFINTAILNKFNRWKQTFYIEQIPNSRFLISWNNSFMI